MIDLNSACINYQTRSRKHRPNYKNPDGFLLCPYCHAAPHLRIEDDEGNDKSWDPTYEKHPWSGLWYVIEHTRDGNPKQYGNNLIKNTGDIPYDKPCKLATKDFQWYGLGFVPHIGGKNAVFTTRKAAVDWWNRMVKQEKLKASYIIWRNKNIYFKRIRKLWLKYKKNENKIRKQILMLF